MKIKDYIPGLVIALVIAVISYYISTLHASFDSLAISIIIGMFFGNFLGEKEYFRNGIEAAIKIFLPVGIAFYGTQLSLKGLNPGMILTIFLIFSALFGITLIVSKIFNLGRKISILLASGLAVCGASAIAVISPLIGAKREDTSISLISVMMLGLTGMIFYPILYDLLSLTKNEFNFLAGTTLPMLGQVRVAAGSVCPECVDAAIKIKLIRISFLFFLVTTAIFISGKEEKKIKVPWFIIVFIFFALFGNFTKLLLPLSDYFRYISSFSLTTALVAIGFSVELDSIIEKGITPFVTIFISWTVVIMMIYIVKSLF